MDNFMNITEKAKNKYQHKATKMSANSLPTEILQHIFKMLDGRDIVECQKVCRQWDNAILDISDVFWKTICAKDHEIIFDEAHKKSRLSWHELYVTLNLWSDIYRADVKLYEVSVKSEVEMQILNGVLSYSELNEESIVKTIVHYDIECHEVIYRQAFDYSFDDYAIGDKITVLHKQQNNELRGILNANNKCVYNINDIGLPWLLFDNNVYYKKGDVLVCVKLIENTNSFDYDIIKYPGLHPNAINYDISRTKSGHICLVTWISFNAKITYQIIDSKLQPITNIRSIEFMPNVKGQGIDITVGDIKHYFSKDVSKIKGIYTYGKVIIIGTDLPAMLYIYYNPTEELQERYCETPAKVINLDEVNTKESDARKSIQQIDVVECVNGHKVIVVFEAKIIVIELSHQDLNVG